MKLTSMRVILMIGLIDTVTAGLLSAKGVTPVKWQTYHSPAYGFTINVPADMTQAPGGSSALARKPAIPICGKNTVACFRYDGEEFNHSVIQSLGLAVNVLRNKKTEASCDNIRYNVTKTTAIHQRPFYYAETGRIVGGSSQGDTLYRTFYRHVCFEIVLATAQSDIPPVRYSKYGIKPVNREALRTVKTEMHTMLHSFTFVGPVKMAQNRMLMASRDASDSGIPPDVP